MAALRDFFERRRTARDMRVLAVGKIRIGNRDHLCIFRQTPEGGVRLDMADGDRHIVVEMLGPDRCETQVAWC